LPCFGKAETVLGRKIGWAEQKGTGIRLDTHCPELEEPILLQAVAWEQIKAFFTAEARRLGQHRIGC